MKSQRKIYLDFAATTPLDPRVEKAMAPFWREKFGNASSLHAAGQEAGTALWNARRIIAAHLGLSPEKGYEDIVFTGSATEANNLVLRGAVKAYQKKNEAKKPRIIISAIEHESILETARDLKEEIDLVELPVDARGVINLEILEKNLTPETILVSIMYANNEIGTIQPIGKITEILKKFKKENMPEGESSVYPLFHTDAVQALQYCDCRPEILGIDYLTISGHKIYGPKGIGVLYVKNRKKREGYLQSIITGGGQEFGLRSGTENLALVIGFEKALEITEKMRIQESERMKKLGSYFLKGLKKHFPGLIQNGGAKQSLPNNINIYLPNLEDALIKLDLHGVMASSGSACAVRLKEPSPVLKAIGAGEKQCLESVRFTLGRQTRKIEIDKVVNILKKLR